MDTFESKQFIFYESNLIRVDLVETYEFAPYRGTTYYVRIVNAFFRSE